MHEPKDVRDLVAPGRSPATDLEGLELEDLAQRVRAGHEVVCALAQQITMRAWQVGLTLIVARGKVPHGRWLPWVQQHCGFEARQAQKYMQLARGLDALAKLQADANPSSHSDPLSQALAARSLNQALGVVRKARRAIPTPAPSARVEQPLEPEEEEEGTGERERITTSPRVRDNAGLMREVAKLYLNGLPDGAVIADVTYGKGVFWREIDTSRFDFRPSDLNPKHPQVHRHDFMELPYEDGSCDVVVLDPPYSHGAHRQTAFGHAYGAGVGTPSLDRNTIMDSYEFGMREAHRILRRPGGLLVLKCNDEIEGGRPHRSLPSIWHFARQIGFQDQDLFVLAHANRWHQRGRQYHADVDHSYLVVLSAGPWRQGRGCGTR